MKPDPTTIATLISHCQNCILFKTRTNTVPGSGNHHAEIMFIGEGPGKNEDLRGEPFVGAAGKYLDQLLDSIQLKRQDVFITNIVKCRPPENRDPEPIEVNTCAPFLSQQIQFIKPLLICTLGRHAMNFFLPELKISKDHGQPKRFQGQVFLPLYHPAAGLYNPANRQAIDQDFLKIPIILKKIKQEKQSKLA